VTRDRARKKAIRSRMAGTREPYSVAARRLGGSQPADDEAALRAVMACARNTLAAPSARIEIRSDWEITHHQGEPRLNVIGKLARFAVRTALKRVEPEMSMADAREAFMHTAGEGFVEPAVGRYLIDLGGHAQMASDGKHFSGPSGKPLGARYQDSRGPGVDPLEVLSQLRHATGARYAADETVRSTPSTGRTGPVSSRPVTAPSTPPSWPYVSSGFGRRVPGHLKRSDDAGGAVEPRRDNVTVELLRLRHLGHVQVPAEKVFQPPPGQRQQHRLLRHPTAHDHPLR
jgi:hypothetical protein